MIHDLGWLTCVPFEKVLEEKLAHKPKAQLKGLIKKEKKSSLISQFYFFFRLCH